MDEFPCEELQEVLYLFKCEREHRLFMNAFEDGKFKATMSRDAAIVCAVFLSLDVRIDDDSEEIDMCKAVKDFRRKCINEGRKFEREENRLLWQEEGRRLGEEEGRKSTIRGIVERLINMKKGVPEICNRLGESETTIQEVVLSLQH